MKKINFIIGLNFLLCFFLFQNLMGQYCYFDSINEKKYHYDQNDKLELISFNGQWPPLLDTVTHFVKLHYNSDSLLESVESFILSLDGDTISPSTITKSYEYENGLLSKIDWNNEVFYDDFVWEDNKLMEYKYYYTWGDTIIDSAQTRILQFTYLNNNIHHFLYYEIASGEVYADYFKNYDTKINPYYQSEVSLVDGDLLDYMCVNNWISTTSGMERTITYNNQNYPIYIYTDAANGNFSYDTISYNCTTLAEPNPPIPAFELEFVPNPATKFFVVKNNNNLKINEVKIFNLNGQQLVHEYDKEIIKVNELKPGIYIVECYFGEITIRKKIIIYTS